MTCRTREGTTVKEMVKASRGACEQVGNGRAEAEGRGDNSSRGSVGCRGSAGSWREEMCCHQLEKHAGLSGASFLITTSRESD